MSAFGTSVAQSMAGAPGAERAAAREKAARAEQKRPAERRTRPDRPDEVVVNVESVDAARKLADNTQEDAREDRQEQGGYLPTGKRAGNDGAPKSIDVEG